ncbi:MAG: SPOR domain-containing protein [Bacteroidales bacterium]|nr:SPOR domain-containing protein [Bacteroidales bacterium]
MKKLTILAAVAVFAVCVSSCDFVRSIAGRPTSDELSTGVAAPGENMEYLVPDSTEAAVCPCDSLCAMPDSLCCCITGVCSEADSLCCKENCPKEEKCAECPKAENCPKAEKCEVAEECDKCEKAAAQAPKPAAKPAPVKKAPAARIFRGPVCEKAALENKYFVVIGTFKVEANACAQAKRAEKAGYKVVSIPFSNCRTAVAVAPTDDRAEALKSLDEVKTKKFCPADAYVLVVK